MTPRRLLVLLLALAAGLAAGSSGHTPTLAWAATCADYPNQAAAQAAGDTRDADGDGIYCESLPCPCSTDPPVRTPPATTTAPPAPAPTATVPPAPAPSAPAPPVPATPTGTTTAPAVDQDASVGDPTGCARPSAVQNVTFSKTKYPHIHQHFLKALRKGWPRILVLNRSGAAKRRARLLEGVPTKPGYDRDEYPPAVGRGQGAGLTSGRNPIGWRADVMLVPSQENRSHGSTMGLKLRRFCSGTRFRYVFY